MRLRTASGVTTLTSARAARASRTPSASTRTARTGADPVWKGSSATRRRGAGSASYGVPTATCATRTPSVSSPTGQPATSAGYIGGFSISDRGEECQLDQGGCHFWSEKTYLSGKR